MKIRENGHEIVNWRSRLLFDQAIFYAGKHQPLRTESGYEQLVNVQPDLTADALR